MEEELQRCRADCSAAERRTEATRKENERLRELIEKEASAVADLPNASIVPAAFDEDKAMQAAEKARFRGVEDRRAVRAKYQVVADNIVQEQKHKRRIMVSVAIGIGLVLGAVAFIVQRTFMPTTADPNNADQRFVEI